MPNSLTILPCGLPLKIIIGVNLDPAAVILNATVILRVDDDDALILIVRSPIRFSVVRGCIEKNTGV